jgi:hypothetical protein
VTETNNCTGYVLADGRLYCWSNFVCILKVACGVDLVADSPVVQCIRSFCIHCICSADAVKLNGPNMLRVPKVILLILNAENLKTQWRASDHVDHVTTFETSFGTSSVEMGQIVKSPMRMSKYKQHAVHTICLHAM